MKDTDGERPTLECRRDHPRLTSLGRAEATVPAPESSWVIDLCNKRQPNARVDDADVGLRPGTLVAGAYRLIELLGSGAMGAVFLAHDESLDRKVAIKFIHHDLLDEAMRERFATEARAMARVKHPNVVQVYAFGEHFGAPFFVMELIEGQTLEQWLLARGAPPELDVALSILDGICRGASAIHAAETIHRDIKPSNVLLDAKFEVHIADLGVADVCRRDRPSQPEAVGTPLYMAPEVAFRRDVDPALRARADVYSIGCVAYQLLTGRTPFEGEHDLGIMVQHAITAPSPPSSWRKDLPPPLDAVIMRALAKEPAERTHSAEAFRRELAAARTGSPGPDRILLAEDDDDFREALATFLGAEFPDADIEACTDGPGVLRAFDRRRPSAVVLDLRMPGLDGMQVTELLRVRDPESRIPIIILTASGGPEEWRRLAERGAARFLLKPVVLDDVASAVRRCLYERTSSRPPPLSG